MKRKNREYEQPMFELVEISGCVITESAFGSENEGTLNPEEWPFATP